MAKITFKNIKAYCQGNIRYFFYYRVPWLLLPHIRQQIDMRIESMDKECFSTGNCVLCGCMTTALQMANKACDKPCYPEMMSRRHWKRFKAGSTFIDCINRRSWSIVNKKFYLERF